MLGLWMELSASWMKSTLGLGLALGPPTHTHTQTHTTHTPQPAACSIACYRQQFFMQMKNAFCGFSTKIQTISTELRLWFFFFSIIRSISLYLNDCGFRSTFGWGFIFPPRFNCVGCATRFRHKRPTGWPPEVWAFFYRDQEVHLTDSDWLGSLKGVYHLWMRFKDTKIWWMAK